MNINIKQHIEDQIAGAIAKRDRYCVSLSEINQFIDCLREALEMDLVEVTSRYLITDEIPFIPAGFDASDRVYIKTDVFIQTDELPKQLSENLKAYDVSGPHRCRLTSKVK